ncbi:MAG: TolC family protein [Elusimicrobiaceae bacterium]|jgi:outer membrane protein TolC
MKKLLAAGLFFSIFIQTARAADVSTAAAVFPGVDFSTECMRQITVDEAYRLALAKSEALAQQKEGVKILEAAERDAGSAFLPTITYGINQIWQDLPDSGASNYQSSKFQHGAALHYSVFSGMRDYLAVKAAGLQTEAARLALIRARQNLYLSATQAYISLYLIQKQIAINQSQLSVTKSRISELSSRERIGRSRKSEVLAARSQLAQDESLLQSALGLERFYQHLLQFLTGLDCDLSPQRMKMPSAPNLNDYIARAMQRPDVEAARKNVEAARLQAGIARRQRWPTLDFDANYYLDRSGSNSGVNWDTTFGLKLPLYTGGHLSAKIDQADAALRSAELGFALLTRQTETIVRQKYDSLTHYISTVESLRSALKLATENAAAQAADYKYGLVTNLEVLSAMNTEFQTRIQLDSARMNAIADGFELEVAAGGPASVTEN